MENDQEPEAVEPPAPAEAGSIPTGTLRWLNLLGDLAHVAVAVLLILITIVVLVYACLSYAPHLALLADAMRPGPAATSSESHPADPFIASSVEFLSNILFAVILLEVLHTTLIFLHDRSSRAIVRAFLVVAILSIVRKLLLVGAESSLTGEKGMPFIYGSLGILISIFGITLLVGCLIYVSGLADKPEH
jgi:uncharacterized membrane protein (DUF373 family)